METIEIIKIVIEVILTAFFSGVGALLVFNLAFSKTFKEEKAAKVAERRFNLYDDLLAQIAEMQFHPSRIFEKNYILSALMLRARTEAYASEDVRNAYGALFRFIRDTNVKFKSGKDELWSSFFKEGELLGFDDCGDPVLEDEPRYPGADKEYRTALTSLHEESLPKAASINTHAKALANAIHDDYEKQRGKK